MKVIKFHVDPGHGWAEVPVSELVELKIVQIISPYSYMSFDAKTAYLEEDCDASTYIAALEESGVKREDMEVINIHKENTFVRSLPNYQFGLQFELFHDVTKKADKYYDLATWREYCEGIEA